MPAVLFNCTNVLLGNQKRQTKKKEGREEEREREKNPPETKKEKEKENFTRESCRHRSRGKVTSPSGLWAP